MSTQSAGYSGTPLAKKLGIREGCRVVTIKAPANYHQLLQGIPANVDFGKRVSQGTDIVHVFSTEKSALKTCLATLRKSIRSDAAVWVSWPKQAAKLPTDITEDTIRELALPLGFVDIKVCAVNAIWSGLKLVIRKELR